MSERRNKEENVNPYHHGDLRRSLVSTAVELLKTLHPQELSLRELARKAGVSQAAPYRHFKNKEELLAAISQEGFEIKFSYMKDAIRTYRTNPREMYIQCGLSYFRMGKLHPQHFRLMVSSNVKPCPEYPELLKIAAATYVLVRDMVMICQEAGVIGPGDPYLRAMHCWTTVNGFTALYADKRLDWLGIEDDNAESFLRTLLEQSLAGAKYPLVLGSPPCQLFQTEFSAAHLAMMEAEKLER